MASGGKGGKPKYPHYYLSMHLGVCHPVDAVRKIIFGERVGLDGRLDPSGPLTVDIVRPDLFGGKTNEGGIEGSVTVYPGRNDQVLIDDHARRMGLTAATAPGYRGLLSLFFTERAGAPMRGFYWAANNPYLKDVAVEVENIPRPFRADIAAIPRGDGAVDANPVHVILECATNTDWGGGRSLSAVNVAAFEAAAQTVFDEGLGVSLLWVQQARIEDFIQEVCNHIDARTFTDPETGLYSIKLIRGDYDPATLFELTPDNSEITTFQQTGWGNITNEIVVTWTNPENEEEETINVQNLAAIAAQGGEIVSAPRNYYGFRSAETAMRVGLRDLEAASSPLATAEARVNREGWALTPGDVVAVSIPERGIFRMPMRIGQVDYGRPGEPWLTIPLVQDVFGRDEAAFTPPPASEWNGAGEDPRPADYVQIITLPYLWVVRSLANTAAGVEYPGVFAGFVVAQEGSDTQEFTAVGPFVDPAGNVARVSLGAFDLCTRGVLPAPLPAEAVSVMSLSIETQGPDIEVGGWLLVGDEWILVGASSVAGFGLRRGALDTVPKAWPAGTPFFFLPDDAKIADGAVRSAGETVTYRILPHTSRGILPEADAPDVPQLLTDRPHAPFRPARVRVNGVGFGSVDLGAAPAAVTWNLRNRLLEDSRALGWDDAGVAPEPGQRTVVELVVGGAVVKTYTVEGSSLTVPRADWAGATSGEIRVGSVRDGIRSHQAHSIAVTNV